MPKTVFYARVSTRDQNPALQVDAAKKMGVKSDDIYVEKASGTRGDRPVLAEALGAREKGDTLARRKLDRVGRSVEAPQQSALPTSRPAACISEQSRVWAQHPRVQPASQRCTCWSAVRPVRARSDDPTDLAPVWQWRARMAKRLGPPVKWQPDRQSKRGKPDGER